MKAIKEYLSNKIKNPKYIYAEFPTSGKLNDIIDWFDRNDFVDISEIEEKNFSLIYLRFDNVEVNKKRFKIKNNGVWFCNSGKISKNNPLFNFRVDYDGKIDYYKMTTTGVFEADKIMDFEDFKTEVDKYIN